MHRCRLLATSALALANAFAGFTSAQAAPLAADGQWATFDVAFDLSGNLGWIDIADGSALSFTFSVSPGSVATLTVVDGGFAGDRFQLSNNGAAFGSTSAAVNSYPANVYLDFDAALATASYSRGGFTLGAGNHRIGGSLLASAIDNTGAALNSTVGGIRLTVTAVPEAATAASLFAGLGLLAVALRRRART